MSVVLPVIAFVLLFVYMANSVGRSWRLRDEERARQDRQDVITRRLAELHVERAGLLAEENGLVTYAEAAKWLPPAVVRVIDQTRPCPVTHTDHRWVLTDLHEVMSSGRIEPVRIDETWTCSSCGDTATAHPERTRP